MPPPHLTTSLPASPPSYDDEDMAVEQRGGDDEDEQSDVLSPFHRSSPLPGTLDVQLNGKQRSSIIEYIQREDEQPTDDGSTVGAPQRDNRDGQDSDDEDDEREASRAAKVMDPFYRELERAEEERNKKKEDEKDAQEERDRQREELITPQPDKAQDDEKQKRLSSSTTATGTSRRSSAVSTPSSASAVNSHSGASFASTPSRRVSRPNDNLPIPGSTHNSRTPSRSSLSANGGLGSTKLKPRMLAGRSGQTPTSEKEGRVTGLPAVVLIGNGGRRRLDKQLAMVRRSVEEVEAGMRRKMEREKEKDRERLAREQQQQQQLLQQQSSIQEETEDEAADTVTSTITNNNTAAIDDPASTAGEQQSSTRSRSETAVIESGKELVVRSEGVLVKSEGGPFASILHNLSFANTLLPLTAEELAMSSTSLTSPTSPRFPSLSRVMTTTAAVSASAPVSPRPLLYQSCFPSWLSSRADFSAFVGQHQLLCLHLAEKERDKRSVKDLAKLSDFFLTFPFFHKFSPHTLTELSRCCFIERRKRGERVDSKSEEGSVMRFVYEGEVTYETSIARLFKRKRKEREREQRQRTEKEKREAEKQKERERQQKEKEAAAARARGGSKGRLAGTVSSAALPPTSRGRSATQTLSATLPLPANSSPPDPSPPQSQGGSKPALARMRTSALSALDNSVASRSRSNTTPTTAALPVVSASSTATLTSASSTSSSQRSSIIAPTNAILSHALTFDPNDSTQALPVVTAASPSASVQPAFAFDSSLDELLVTHKLVTGDTFGHSLLFEHLFASYSFSQIYKLKQQQRLHAILSRNPTQRGWGTARQLVRSLLEQKSSLHIHSVEVLSDDCLFFCWQHSDLEAIAKESRRFDTNEMVGALRVLPFFTSWPFSTIQDTAARAESRTMKRGDWLVHEGEPTNSLFFVVRGEVEAVKHCSLIQAERWPAGAHTWEVTKTQRVKAYPIGRLGEGEVVGVEGVCGVATRDFSVRVVSATCVVYVVKRVAFAGWSGMKKVMRDCQARMMEWRERATQQVQLQAEGKRGKHKPWQQQQDELKASYLKQTAETEAESESGDTVAAPSPLQSGSQQQQEEEKVQLESDRSHAQQQTDNNTHQPPSSRLSRTQSTLPSRVSTQSHRQAPLQGSGRHTVTDSTNGDLSEEQAEERRQRRKRLREEEAARVRRGTQRNEDYWLDRVLTVERMQEDKARRRKLALRRHDDGDTAAKPGSRPQQQDEQLVEAVRLRGELPLLSDRERVRERRGNSGLGSGGIRVERQAAAIDLHQRRAIVDRTLDSQRWETAMSAVVQLHFDAPT